MKTYKIDPLGKNRPLMLVRGTRLPESFPDSVAEHMAKSLKANCRGVFTTINGEISSLTASPGVVVSREANEDNNTLVVMTEGKPNESVDLEDSTGKQFRIEHAGQFVGSQYGGHDLYYTGAHKDLRTFVTGAVPYTGQPLVAANAKQWYSYTTHEGVALTFRGCIQAPVKEGTDFVGLKIDSINFLSSDTSPSFKLTLDCDRAISFGLRNGMNDNSKPFNMKTGIGWLQIVATDDFTSHLHEFNSNAGNGDATIASYEAYDGFTYNVDLRALNAQPGGWASAGNQASFRIYAKSGSALEDSIIANASGYACESLGYDMSGSGDTFPMVEEVSPALNAEPTIVNLTPDNRKQAVVVRLSSVQDGEQLHLDLSDTVTAPGLIRFRSMNTAILGTKLLDSGKKSFVIDIPHGDDVFAYFGVNYNAAGTLTISRTTEQSEPSEPVRTPGFYSSDGQLIKAMTKEEVETDYTPSNCPSKTNAEVKNATEFVWPEGVTSIGESAFDGCSGLTSVTIPSTVTSLGESTFYGCSGLTSVEIPEGVTSIDGFAFYGCSGLTSVTIPSTVTSLGIDAFSGCSGLTSVTIPEGVTSISRDAFYGCSGLTSVTIPSTVTSIGDYAFYDCSGLASVTIPEGVTTIGTNAFYGCSGLTSVEIPEGVTSISRGAFDGCSGLTSVTIPSTVTSLGESTFYDCRGLNPLTVPNTVATIGNDAFKNVPRVIYGGTATGSPWGALEVVAPARTPGFYNKDGQLIKAMTKEEVEQNGSIGDQSIRDNATEFVWPEGVTKVGSSKLSGFNKLTSVEIPEGVTSIDGFAFSGCSGLTSVTIPSTVTSIGSNAFYDCTRLTSVTIPEGVTSISDSTFKNCTSLTSVTIPDSVTSIGEFAFDSCTSLNPLTVPNTVTTIGNSAFRGVPKVVYNGSASGSPWGATEVSTGGSTPDPGPGPEPEPEPTRDPGFYSANGQLIKAMTKAEVETHYTNNNCPSTVNAAIKNATEFVWPEGVTRVGNRVFRGTKLTSVSIPEGVTSIGTSAFSGCSSLTSVTIPAGVTTIRDTAFSECSALTSVTIPEGVKSLGDGAFSGCSALNQLTVPNTVTSIGVIAFSGVQKVIYNGSAPGSPWGAKEVATS